MSVRKTDAPDGAWCHGRGPSRGRPADVIAGPPPSSKGLSSAGRRLVLFSVGRMRSFPLPPRRTVLQSAPLLGPAFVAHLACADRGDFATNTQGAAEHGYQRRDDLQRSGRPKREPWREASLRRVSRYRCLQRASILEQQRVPIAARIASPYCVIGHARLPITPPSGQFSPGGPHASLPHSSSRWVAPGRCRWALADAFTVGE